MTTEEINAYADRCLAMSDEELLQQTAAGLVAEKLKAELVAALQAVNPDFQAQQLPVMLPSLFVVFNKHLYVREVHLYGATRAAGSRTYLFSYCEDIHQYLVDKGVLPFGG